MAGILSKGVKLGYKTTSAATSYTNIENIQSFPDLGVTPDQVDTTTLADSYTHSIPGLKSLSALEFTCLFDNSSSTSNFQVLKGLEDAGDSVWWQVEFPDALTASTGHGTTFSFTGRCAVAAMGKGVNEALQFTLSIFIESDIVVANPS